MFLAGGTILDLGGVIVAGRASRLALQFCGSGASQNHIEAVR